MFKCHVVFRDSLGYCDVEVMPYAGIKFGPFLEFETEFDVYQIPIENIIEIYFD